MFERVKSHCCDPSELKVDCLLYVSQCLNKLSEGPLFMLLPPLCQFSGKHSPAKRGKSRRFSGVRDVILYKLAEPTQPALRTVQLHRFAGSVRNTIAGSKQAQDRSLNFWGPSCTLHLYPTSDPTPLEYFILIVFRVFGLPGEPFPPRVKEVIRGFDLNLTCVWRVKW